MSVLQLLYLFLVSVTALVVALRKKLLNKGNVGSALVIGCVGHFAAVAVRGGGIGLGDIILFPILYPILALASVGFCALIGFFLRLAFFKALWRIQAVRLSVLFVALGLFIYGLSTGAPPPPYNPNESVDSENNQAPGTLGATTYPGLFGFIFVVMHWPKPLVCKKKPNHRIQATAGKSVPKSTLDSAAPDA